MRRVQETHIQQHTQVSGQFGDIILSSGKSKPGMGIPVGRQTWGTHHAIAHMGVQDRASTKLAESESRK